MLQVLFNPRGGDQIVMHDLDPQWCVRRIKSTQGVPMARPKIWGIVRASSETAAITRFIHLLKVEESALHFDAVRADGKR